MLAAEPGALQVDGEDAVPIVLRHRAGVEVGVDAGVVDQLGDRTELTDGQLDRVPDLLLVGHVAGEKSHAFALKRAARVGVRVECSHHRALGGKPLHDRAADAAGAAGDDRDLPLQSAHQSVATDRSARRSCQSSAKRSKWIWRGGWARITPLSTVTPRPVPVGSAKAPSTTAGLPGAQALMPASSKSLKCSRILK